MSFKFNNINKKSYQLLMTSVKLAQTNTLEPTHPYGDVEILSGPKPDQ